MSCVASCQINHLIAKREDGFDKNQPIPNELVIEKKYIHFAQESSIFLHQHIARLLQ